MRRLPGIPPRQWTKEFLDATVALRAPTGGPVPAEPPGPPRGMATIESFAQHLALAQAFFPFNGHVLHGTTLPQRIRGMIVLRVAHKRQCEYMWSQHFITGRTLGLSDDVMMQLTLGSDEWSFAAIDVAAMRAVDELIDDGVISQSTWDALAAELDAQQLLDLIFTVGCYETVTYFMRSLNLEPDSAVQALLEANPPLSRSTTEGTTAS